MFEISEKTSIDFDFRLKKIHFYNENLEKGSFKTRIGGELTSWVVQIQFDYHITYLGQDLITGTERKFFFHFKIIVNPKVTTINFDGDFILETQKSHDQNKLGVLINKRPDSINRYVLEPFILKNSYEHAANLANRARIRVPFPPVNELFKEIGRYFSNQYPPYAINEN